MESPWKILFEKIAFEAVVKTLASLMADLIKLIGRKIGERFRSINWQYFLAYAVGKTKKFLSQRIVITPKQLLIDFPKWLLPFVMLVLFYIISFYAFFLGIVEHGYSAPHAFLVAGGLVAAGHLTKWYSKKLISA